MGEGTTMRRIAIINQKGGVGKTTTVANLGAALALAGKRVIVFDMDPQANLSLYLGSEVGRGDASVYGVLTEGLPVQDALLVASHLDLSGAELELASTMSRETLLRDAINLWEAEALEKDGFPPADYILLDCPPSLGLLSINALVAAEEVMIAVQTEFFALQGLSKLVEVIQLLRRRMNPALTLTGILPCLYDSRLKLAREVLAELRRFFPGKVYPTPVRTNVRLAESPSHGMTIFEYAPGSNGAKDYHAMGVELLKRSPTEERPMPSQVEVVNDDQAKELHRAAEGLRELEAPTPDHWATNSGPEPDSAPAQATEVPEESSGQAKEVETGPSQAENVHAHAPLAEEEAQQDSTPVAPEAPLDTETAVASTEQNAVEVKADTPSTETHANEPEQVPVRTADGVDAELAIYELPRAKSENPPEAPPAEPSESFPITEIPTSNPLTGLSNESQPANLATPIESSTATLLEVTRQTDSPVEAPVVAAAETDQESEPTTVALNTTEIEAAPTEALEAEPEKPKPTPVMGFGNYIGEDRWTRKPQERSGD